MNKVSKDSQKASVPDSPEDRQHEDSRAHEEENGVTGDA